MKGQKNVAGDGARVRTLDSQPDAFPEGRLLSANIVTHRLLLGIIFAVALVIRGFGINEPPLDFHPVKQYRSAMTVRAYYYEHLNSIPEWKKKVAHANVERLGTLVPPIMERIVAIAYVLAGGEHVWIGRALSAVSWVTGGIFLYFIARRIGSVDAAMLSAAWYLFLPFGVRASQSFQPDPLMVMMMIVSLFTIVRFHERSSMKWLLIAGTVSGAAILIKPVSLFIILGAYASLAFYNWGVRRPVVSGKVLLFITLSLVPAGLFYGHGLLLDGVLQNQMQVSFLPHLWFKFFFWQFWLKHIYGVVGFAALVGALLGVLFIPSDWRRVLIVGLWAGYLAYGLTFTYHIHTHDYYQLPLIPIVALSLGPLGASILSQLIRNTDGRFRRVVVRGIFAFAVLLHLGLFIRARQELPDFTREIKLAEEIGDAVQHSTRTIILAPHGGRPLQYHGHFAGEYWPDVGEIRASKLWGEREMSVQERFDTLTSEDPPEFFIVTDFEEFESQIQLKQFLTENFTPTGEDSHYMIFSLQTARRR